MNAISTGNAYVDKLTIDFERSHVLCTKGNSMRSSTDGMRLPDAGYCTGEYH